MSVLLNGSSKNDSFHHDSLRLSFQSIHPLNPSQYNLSSCPASSQTGSSARPFDRPSSSPARQHPSDVTSASPPCSSERQSPCDAVEVVPLHPTIFPDVALQALQERQHRIEHPVRSLLVLNLWLLFAMIVASFVLLRE